MSFNAQQGVGLAGLMGLEGPLAIDSVLAGSGVSRLALHPLQRISSVHAQLYAGCNFAEGGEKLVTLVLSPLQGRTHMQLIHAPFGDQSVKQGYTEGWADSFSRLLATP
jgi:hypothetical protein